MKRKQLTIAIAVIAGLVLIWWIFFRKKEQPVVIQTEVPERGYISESVTATGKIQPVDTVTVGTQVSGVISKLYADFNSTVKAGQLLAELDKVLLQAQADQIRANLVQARSNETYQTNNFSRQKQLYETGSISKQDYEIAMNTYNAARATSSSIAAQLRSAERNLYFTNIYSPIDGVVLNRNVNIGQTVAASFNTPTLFVIAKDITKMQVQANVDEADIGNVNVGLRASFTVDAFLEDEFAGQVREIRLSPSVSSNVVTYTTLIDANNDDKKLKPGMTANITIYTKEEKDALLIPVTAIKFRPDSALNEKYTLVPDTTIRSKGGKGRGERSGTGKPKQAEGTDRASVWILDGERLVQKRIVIGLNDNTRVQVLSGLAGTEKVVTNVEGLTSPEGGQGNASSPFMPQRRRR